MKRGRPKNRMRYLYRAARRFLEGTGCRTPEEAVRRGRRSLEEWADILHLEREAMLTHPAAEPSTEPNAGFAPALSSGGHEP